MIAEMLVLAVEEVERSPLEMILPPPAELFWGAVAFVIVYFIVARLAFPKINELLDERSRSIEGRMEEAEAKLTEAEQTRVDYEQQLGRAREEANAIVEEGRDTAESVRREIIARAEAEAEQVLERARDEIGIERERAVRQLRSEVSRLSVELAEKIVQRELDAAAHSDLIDRYIETLTTTNGGSPAGQGTPR